MKKIKYILLFILVVLLSGCDTIIDQINQSINNNNNHNTDDGKYTISEIIKLDSNTVIDVGGTVSLVNEVGFILTDASDSIFVNYPNANNTFQKGETINISGNFKLNNGYEIELESYEKNNAVEEKSVPTTLNHSNSSTFVNSYNNSTSHVRFETFVDIENNEPILKIGTQKVKLDVDAINEKATLTELKNKKVILSGWLYKKDSGTSALIMMLDKIDHVYENTTTGYAPVVEIKTNYYSYTSVNNIKDLTSYFKVTDDKDGIIKVSSSMISGTVTNGQNIVSLKVTDSDSNVSIVDIIIDIHNYAGYETNESINVIDEYCMPTTGNVKILVIPVDLGDNPATDEMRNNISKAFFGTEVDTGWESLSSYYKESSYGKLNISGSVTPWFTPSKSPSYYANYEDDDDYSTGSTLIMNEALNYFKNSYNYSDYDSNKDGYIDAVYMIYNYDIGGNGSYVEEDFYWAYTYWDLNADYRNYGNTKGYNYVFMGYDFFKEDLAYSSAKPALNCETLIHETGHLMNLDDYYDYDDQDIYSNDGGYCGADMMDYNFGDHGPLSKILLDWVNPIVIERSGIYELPSFTTTGTTFLVSANGGFGTIFDEYYLIDFYTFAGLNKLQAKDFYTTTKNYAGVRVSHANVKLTKEEGYFPVFTYNNTDTKYKQLRMLEADYDGTFDLNSSTNEGSDLSDFYQVGQTFGTGYYSTYKSSLNNNIPFTMEVLEINDNFATVKIIFK